MSVKKKHLYWVFYMIFIVVFSISLYIPYLEFSVIGGLTDDLQDKESAINIMDYVVDRIEHLQTLLIIEIVGGQTISAMDKELLSERAGGIEAARFFSSFDTFQHMCNTMNQVMSYTNITIDCWKAATSDEENKKFLNASLTLVGVKGDYKKEVWRLQGQIKEKEDMRNFLYLLLIVLTGLGSAYRYFLEKHIN